MFSVKSKPHRILLLSVAGVVAILGVLIFIVPPALFPDPSWGFQVMRGMEQGHPFNMLLSPNPDNIALDDADFLSWWSPGQYLVPYFFKTILWLSTGKATALTVSFCALIGLAGFYQLFKRLGFSPWIAAISIAFIACQNYFISPFIFYPGGEILLFAFCGWFLYGCFGVRKITWQGLVFVFLAGIIGFFAKSSMLWMYAAGVACIWINISSDKRTLQHWLRNGALLAIPVVCALGIIFVVYMAKGTNPSNAGGAWLIKPETLSFPLASPLISALSLDEAVNGFIYHPDTAVLSYGVSIIIVVLFAFGSLFFVNGVLRRMPYKNYALALTLFYIVAILFFSYLYLKQATVSFEGRHFRIIGLLVIPGIVWFISKTKASRIAFGLAWLVFFCWEVAYFSIEYKVNIHAGHGYSGLSQQSYDQATFNEIERLDALHPHKALFVCNAPDLAIDIHYNRVLTLDIQDMTAKEVSDLKYQGKAGSIFILISTEYVKSGVADRIAKSFTDYKHFTSKQLSGDYYLYLADN